MNCNQLLKHISSW